MFIIINILQVKRKKDRWVLMFENNCTLELDAEIIVRNNFRIGSEISPEVIDRLSNEDKFLSAYKLALRWLLHGKKTRKEIYIRLTHNDINDTIANKVCDKLEEAGKLNLFEFATIYVKDKIKFSNYGPALIKQHLMIKGVSEDLSDEVIRQYYTAEQEREKIIKVIRKRNRVKSNHTPQKLIAFLIRQGFSTTLIREVLKNKLDLSIDE